MKIVTVVAARPNFMKVAPFIRAIANYNSDNKLPKVEHVLVHTGQHYDIKMSEVFFRELSIPEPDINMEIGSGSHAEQLGYTMIAFEKVLVEYKPDWVVVVGDVNATLACSVVAKRLNIKVCHIEAGLRAGDMSMPEEINRLVTDRISDLLLTPDTISSANLRNEGTPENKIAFVGNIMIDTLEANREMASALALGDIINNNLSPGYNFRGATPSDNSYAVMTLHRPSNVDQEQVFFPIIKFLLNEVTKDFTLIWPIHPRAEKQLKAFGLWERVLENDSIILLEPVGYREMLRLRVCNRINYSFAIYIILIITLLINMIEQLILLHTLNMGAKIMLTDSGGLQEECCILGTPCLTLRWNTERPVTLREYGGVSVLVGNDIDCLREEYNIAISQERKPIRPELWDGRTAERCLQEILKRSLTLNPKF